MAHLGENALTTVHTVKDLLGISTFDDDTWLEYRIRMYSELFERATGRKFHYSDGHIEKVASSGDTRLVISDYLPLISVSEIKDPEGTVLDPSTYEIADTEVGFIRSKAGAFASSTVRRKQVGSYPIYEEQTFVVTYEGGYVTQHQDDEDVTLTRNLPYDIEMAVVEAIKADYQAKDRDPNIKSMSVLGDSVSYAGTTGRDSAPFVDAVNRYKRLVVV